MRQLALTSLSGFVLLATLGAAGCAAPGDLVAGPYVQSVTPRGAKVVARTAGEVRCRLDISRWDGDPLGTLEDAAPTRHHVFQVDPLPPDTRYRYDLHVDGVAVPIASESLRTAPEPDGRPIRVTVLGDSGELRWWAVKRQRHIARQALLYEPDLVLHVGDLVRSQGGDPLDEHVAAAFRPMAPLLATAPLYAVLGNHDEAIDGGKMFLELLELPAGPEGERYYSFDYGPAHFVAVDTARPDSLTPRQLDWIAADLAATTRRWKVVFTHRPPLGTKADGTAEDPPALTPLWRACQAGGAHLLLAGHRHAYVRYRPPPGGPTLVISGGAGAPLSRTLGVDPRIAVQEPVNHHLRLEISVGRIDIEAVGFDGQSIDRHSLTR